MTTIKAIRLASLVTAINVLVASGFSIAAIIRPEYLLPAGSVLTQASLILAMYAAARTIPLALFALGAIYKQATSALLILGALAGAMQLLDAGIGLFEHDLGNALGRSLSPSSNSSWCICFTDPCASRRKPSADKRTRRSGTSKFAPVARRTIKRRDRGCESNGRTGIPHNHPGNFASSALSPRKSVETWGLRASTQLSSALSPLSRMR